MDVPVQRDLALLPGPGDQWSHRRSEHSTWGQHRERGGNIALLERLGDPKHDLGRSGRALPACKNRGPLSTSKLNSMASFLSFSLAFGKSERPTRTLTTPCSTSRCRAMHPGRWLDAEQSVACGALTHRRANYSQYNR